MCGDIESESPLEQQIIEHFRAVAGQYLAAARHGGGDDPAHDYMNHLFSAVLGKCLEDLDDAEDGGSLEQLQAQAVVLSRLAGILTGQLPPAADALHASMDALVVGYGEARGSDDDHHHGHDHGHGHHHHH